MHRRTALGALWAAATYMAAGPARAVSSESSALSVLDLTVEGDPRLARRALVLVPKGLPEGSRVPVLVLLHGLGETGNEIAGIHAWEKRYGLVRAYERLRDPPVVAEAPKSGYLTDARAERINADLRTAPLSPVVMVCPVTPNPGAHPSRAGALDRYADWLHDVLLPVVAERVPVADIRTVGLDGCSLGGYVALETFLRRPVRLSTLGTVQAAFGEQRAPTYADRIAEAMKTRAPLPVHIETSTWDPYRKANERLVRELAKRDVMAVLDVIPGAHNQPWLREVGTVEMLRWQSRALSSMQSRPR